MGVVLALLGASISYAAESISERDATLRRAIELHDAGSYDAAIKVYHSLLEENPEDGVVLYEIAMSYAAAKDYENCITHATRSSRIKSTAQASAFAMIANCQDDSGQADKALKTFAEALEVFPKSVMLNFNYAITLLRKQEVGRAKEALRVAIAEEPRYPSPYLAYASILDDEGHTSAALLMYLRFIMAEPESDRSIDAAARVLKSFAGALSEENDVEKEIRITMPNSNAESSEGSGFEHLSVALAVAGAVPNKADDGAPLEAPERVTLAMKLFVTIPADVDDRELKQSFVWKTAAEPLLKLNEREVLDAFLYHVAALGRVEGAAQRINAQPEAMRKLGQVIGEMDEQLRKK